MAKRNLCRKHLSTILYRAQTLELGGNSVGVEPVDVFVRCHFQGVGVDEPDTMEELFLEVADRSPTSDLGHQLQHGLLGDRPPLLEQFDMGPAVPVPAVVLLGNLCNSGLQGRRGSGPWRRD